jgi:hypothetical protein
MRITPINEKSRNLLAFLMADLWGLLAFAHCLNQR